MALVLTAGVVHAQVQGLNFKERTNLPKADIAPANIAQTTFSWGHTGEESSFSYMIFNDVQGYNISQGESMATKFDNFVIRVSGLEEGASYTVEFLNGTYGGGSVLATMNFWRDDVHIAPLPALLSNATAINNIKSVRLKSNSGRGRLTLEEAYFISAYKGLVNKENDVNGNSVYAGFLDKNNVDIGNAYIDPSYLIRSNRLWLDINDGTNGKPNDRTFYIVCEPGSVTQQLALSLPYETGIDMSNVTFTATDFDRTADVMNRFICDNHTVDLQHKEGESGYSAATRDVRKLYNSRYSGSFYDALTTLL